MASTLTLALVFVMLCTVCDTWDLKSDLAPFSLSNTSSEYQYSHRLSCRHHQRIVVRYVQNGYKAQECHCETDPQCCQFSRKDCLRNMPLEIFQQVTMECWDKSKCRPLVRKVRDRCQKYGEEFPWPAYSQVLYHCMPASTVVDMTRHSSASGSKVTARALPTGLPHGLSVTCTVQMGKAWEGVPVSLEAMISQGPGPRSCLRVDRKRLCRKGRTETEFVAYMPLTFTLQQPAGSSMHFAWVVAQGLNGFHIRVSCEPKEATLPYSVRPPVSDADVTQSPSSRSPPTSTTTQSTASTTLPTSATKASKSSRNPPTSSTTQNTGSRTLPSTRELLVSETRDGGTPTSVPVSSSPGDEPEPGQDASPPQTDSVAVVVAGLVAGVVGALAAGLVILLWRRRRGTKGKQSHHGGHSMKEDLPEDRRDVTHEPLVKTAGETSSHNARLAPPQKV